MLSKDRMLEIAFESPFKTTALAISLSGLLLVAMLMLLARSALNLPEILKVPFLVYFVFWLLLSPLLSLLGISNSIWMLTRGYSNGEVAFLSGFSVHILLWLVYLYNAWNGMISV